MFKIIKNLFKKRVKEDKNNIKLVFIDDEDDDLAINLGITKERCAEIGKTILSCLNERPETDLRTACKKITDSCVHVNEIWWAGMQLGSWYQKQEMQRDSLGGLRDLLKHLGDDQE